MQRTKATLDAAEYTVYLDLKRRLGDISDLLNEKMPPTSPPIALPKSYRASIVAESSRARVYHADERIARRASTIAALAQIVKERDVSMGLRNTLVTQAERLHRLASQFFAEIAGTVPPEQLARETTGPEQEKPVRTSLSSSVPQINVFGTLLECLGRYCDQPRLALVS